MVKHDDRAIDAVQATITTLRRSLNVSIYLLLPFNESRASFTEEEKKKFLSRDKRPIFIGKTRYNSGK